MPNEFRKASDVLNALFSGFNSEGMRQSNEFIRGWKEAVGEKIAAHSKVIDVDRGVLVIDVDHPGWNQQLQYVKKRVIASISRSFPELGINSIAVRVKTVCATPYARQEGPPGKGLKRVVEKDETENVADASVNENLDPELKDLFMRLRESIKKGKPV